MTAYYEKISKADSKAAAKSSDSKADADDDVVDGKDEKKSDSKQSTFNISNDDSVNRSTGLRLRRRGVPTIPNVLRPNLLPRHVEDSPDCRHCKLSLILFKPWRSVFRPADSEPNNRLWLRESHQTSWAAAWTEFAPTAPETTRVWIRNMDGIHQGLTQYERERKAGMPPPGQDERKIEADVEDHSFAPENDPVGALEQEMNYEDIRAALQTDILGGETEHLQNVSKFTREVMETAKKMQMTSSASYTPGANVNNHLNTVNELSNLHRLDFRTQLTAEMDRQKQKV